MSKDRETDRNVGWGRSDKQIFSIPNGATGANVAPVDLGRNYAYVVIKCTGAAHPGDHHAGRTGGL